MTVATSIIIPAYQAESFITDAVKSVMAQTRDDWELVIASDDGQDYLQVLATHGIRDKRLHSVSTGGIATGVANTRNTALRAAKGRIIASLDADDLLHPKALEVLVPLVLKHGAAYSHTRLVDFATAAPAFNCNRELPEGLTSLPDILTSNLYTFAGIVFDRERLQNLGWPDVVRWEDVLFVAACCDALGSIYHVPQSLYIYRLREGSVCNRAETAEEFKSWAERILADLQRSRMRFTHPATVSTLETYLSRRIQVEIDCVKALEAGLYRDYRHFIQENLQLFHTLALAIRHGK